MPLSLRNPAVIMPNNINNGREKGKLLEKLKIRKMKNKK